MNEARKSRDSARTLLLSTILADLKNTEIALGHEPSDPEAVEAAAGRKAPHRVGGAVHRRARQDLADKEAAEIKMIEAFLPASVPPGRKSAPPSASPSPRVRKTWKGDGRRDAAIQRPGGRKSHQPDRARGVGVRLMTHPGGITPSVLDTLEFHPALGRVAEHVRRAPRSRAGHRSTSHLRLSCRHP